MTERVMTSRAVRPAIPWLPRGSGESLRDEVPDGVGRGDQAHELQLLPHHRDGSDPLADHEADHLGKGRIRITPCTPGG